MDQSGYVHLAHQCRMVAHPCCRAQKNIKCYVVDIACKGNFNLNWKKTIYLKNRFMVHVCRNFSHYRLGQMMSVEKGDSILTLVYTSPEYKTFLIA